MDVHLTVCVFLCMVFTGMVFTCMDAFKRTVLRLEFGMSGMMWMVLCGCLDGWCSMDKFMSRYSMSMLLRG